MGLRGDPQLMRRLQAGGLGRSDPALVRHALCFLEVSGEGQRVKRKLIFFLGYKKGRKR